MRKRQVVLRGTSTEESSRSSAAAARSVRYAECQKNHAAAMGGYSVDGCRDC
ncbi:PREDICTED: mini zinc finger protein 2-like [Tarenaya hassleriana]|uniref:mini zinc finger protein 2-like n=1 Tax=Tarenaya hassleriana TaxID=28532 RepID=UPI0008FD447F|nr:PREDICTED: mini zinc finger protein 2-like [Tarenaya hassleriana]